MPGCDWIILIRHGQFWYFDEHFRFGHSDSVKSLLTGCPQSAEAGDQDLLGVGASEPGLQKNVFAWERGGPDNVVYLPTGLKLTGEKYGLLIAKDGNLWLKRGGCWDICGKVEHLLRVPGVEYVDEMAPWAGKGPDSMTYLPGRDGPPRLLAVRAGRYWLYNFLESETYEPGWPFLWFVAQGLLSELFLTEIGGGNTRESLRITKADVDPDSGGPDFELFPWSGPLFEAANEWEIRSGPDLIIYIPNQGRFLITKGTRLLNTWEH
ncbi:hypothetical protein J7M28_08125 [bacterium]|nr:hypothetical protein [bacterium]